MQITFQAAVFDMDGVITRTAATHAAAWKAAFDELLGKLAAGQPWQPFDERSEYHACVDGKSRLEGVRGFLQARGITLSEREQEELARRKTEVFERMLRERVETFDSTKRLIAALRTQGIRTGLVTSSRHGRAIVQAAGIASLFDVILDGNDIAQQSLQGKPAPDMFLKAAESLCVAPVNALVFEDAVAGVQAGRRGGFGLVVGVDRGGNAGGLASGGADMVVEDLDDVDVDQLEASFRARRSKMAWQIEAEGFDPAREQQMESLFAIGNGYLGVRASLDTPAFGCQPDLFIAGIYDAKSKEAPYSDIELLAPDRNGYPYAELVPLPSPFRLELSIEGESFQFESNGRELRRTLDLRAGVVHIDAVYETTNGRRTAVQSRRCASLAAPHLLLQEACVQRENHWAVVALGATLTEPQLVTSHPHLELLEHLSIGNDLELARYRTRASRFEICIASRISVEPERLRRMVCLSTSRDGPDPRAAALEHVRALEWDRFDALFADHEAAWADFWSRADIQVRGHYAVEQALRFASYHLRLPAGNDERVSIGARTLSGRAYEGHVFWDAEIFMLPFHLHTEPAHARNLLMYRFHTLDGARRRAVELGWRGACYAWESTVTGEDVTPSKIILKSTGKEIPILTGTRQVHVTADIAYAVWRYWESTLDEEFLAKAGAEILFETARFWSSRVTLREGLYHILGVIGPDEYHYLVDDNAYTNWMARFNLERAVWAAQYLQVHQKEAKEWSAVARFLYCPGPGADGVIEQFAGFFALKDYPIPLEDRFKAPVSRLFNWEEINQSKIVKQADVLMLPFLFQTPSLMRLWPRITGITSRSPTMAAACRRRFMPPLPRAWD